MRKLTLILFLLILIAIESFSANKYFVAINGSDINNGLSLLNSKRNIQSAIDMAINGDTVLVNNGIYYEKLYVSNKNIILISNFYYTKSNSDLDNTIIDGTNAGSLPFARTVVLGQINSSTLLLGFTIRNGNNGGLYIQSGNPRVYNCKILNNKHLGGGAGTGIWANSSNGVDFQNLYVSGNISNYTIEINNSVVSFKNCLIEGNTNTQSIIFLSQSGTLNIINSTITNNNITTNRIIHLNGGNTTNISNSIIYNNVSTEIYVEFFGSSPILNLSNSLVDTNKIIGSTNNVIKNYGLGIITGNPHFQNPSSKNYQLKDYSICIGAGTLTNMPSKDLNNQNRPLPAGSLPDLGVFENINGINAPVLTSIQTTQGKIKLNWTHTPSTNILRYRIFRSTASSTSVLIDSVAANVFTFTDSLILNSTQYYYRIVAINNQMVPSGFSNEKRATALQNPLLTAPLNNSVSNSKTPILKWRKNASATTYLVQASLDSLFATTVLNSTLTDTSVTITTTLLYNTNYFWRVRANDSLGISNWSSVSKFQTELSKPVLTSIQTTQGKIKLNWTQTPNTNILRYRIYRSASPGASVLIDSVTASVFTFTDSLILNNTQYYYRIVAVNNQRVPSGFSNERRANALQNPLLTSPLNNSVSNSRTPILKWRKNAFATTYLVQASLDSLFATTILNSTRTDTSFTITTTLLYNTNYFWRVRANDSLGISNWSLVSKFQTELSKPVLTSIQTTQGKIKLNWTQTPNTNILRYRIYRSTSPGASVLIDSVAAGVFTFTDSLILNNTQYYYRIVAVNNQRVPSGFSNERRANALQNPLLTSPLNNSVSNSRTPILKWRKNASATTYLVQASLDSLFATTVLNSTRTDTSFTITTALLYNTNYFWRVRANDSLGISNWSLVSKFQTELSKPVLTSIQTTQGKIKLNWTQTPNTNILRYRIYRSASPGASVLIDSVTASVFTFTDSLILNNTQYYYRIVAVNNQRVPSGFSNERRANALQNPLLTAPLNNSVSNSRTPILKWRKNASATTYLVQASLDSLFATTVLNSTLTDTSVTITSTLLYNTNYFWRVRANDSLGISNWSLVSKFQTELSKPVLTSIQTTQGKIKLNWTHTPNTNILRYRIYRSTSPSASVLIDSVIASVFTFTDSLILNNTQYYYRIVAVNNQRVPSGFSNERRANALQNPLLTSPLNNSVSNSRTPILKWRKNPFATTYLVQASVDSLFATTIFSTITADTSATITTALLYNTNYFWRVRANDSLGISNWSLVSKFQTELSKPVLTSIQTTQGKIKLNWTHTPNTNILRYRIYRSTSPGASVLIDSVIAGVFTFTDSLILNNTQYYYRLVAVNNQRVPSEFSNERRANALQNPLLTSPINNSVSNSRTPILKWRKNPFATTYLVQASVDSLFATTIFSTITADTSATITTALLYNTNYFWRVRANDSLGISNWSLVSKFQTELKEVQFDSLIAGNHKSQLFWSYANINNIKYYKIYRKSDTSSTYSLVKQISLISSNNSIIDSGLINNIEYKYYVLAENFDSVNSNVSNILSTVPFNKKPICVKLNDVNIPNAGRKISNIINFTSVGSYDPDGKIDSVAWFVNNKKVSNNILLNYGFRQGTNQIKLVIYDSDLAKDSSIAKLNISTFKKQFNGAIVSGLTAADNNRIYISDDVFTSGIGSKIYQLDSLGQTKFELIVSQQIRSTPSITPDTSLLITNGSLLNGFTKTGVPLFGVVSLGGLTNVTPTVDSMFNRLYLGASNRKFFAINYSNGGAIEWDFTCDAAISTSAIISNDRKLIFSDIIGTIYGFDVSTTNSQGTNPKWKFSLNDTIVGSLAIDLNNNLYVGAKSGKIYKLRLESNGNVTILWTKLLSGTISSSPVIDGNGKIYVGDESGVLFKLNEVNGNTIWTYNSQGAIKSTPYISDSNIVYVASYNGLLSALDTNGNLYWYYKDSSGIVSNILHIEGTTYVGTMNGDYLAFWDRGLKSYGRNSNIVQKPVWSTYQGNFRRTGILRSNNTSIGINTIDFKELLISIFPNPASTEINVILNSINSIVMMDMLLIDINGKIIKSLPVKEYQAIDITDLNKGVYFIKIGTLYQKFIKY